MGVAHYLPRQALPEVQALPRADGWPTAKPVIAVPYFQSVHAAEQAATSPHNKRVVYHLPMKAAAETTIAIAAIPQRLGPRISVTAVLHTWG